MPAVAVDFAGAIAVTGSGSVDVESNSVFNDAAGNVYITGSLQGTANFSPTGSAVNVTSLGGRDAFLAKYSNTGALVWVKDIRGANSASVAQGSAITVDASGNVIVTGTFTGSFNFDPGTGMTSLGALARNDVYVAKYNSSGALVWAKQVVGSGNAFDQGYAVAVDGAGNIGVGGTFQGTASFGSAILSAGGSSDSFVSKLDANGNFLWTRATTGTGSSLAQTSGLTFDASNNLILAGFYAGTVDFDPTNTLLQLPVYGSRDIFVQKFDGSGNLAWTKSVGSPDIDQANSVAADASGNVYVTGTFSSTADFDPGPSVSNLNAGGFEDGFILKLNASGGFLWAKDLSTTGYNAAQGTGIALDTSGHVFVAGYYQGTLTLAAGQTLTSAGSYDVFLGEYDTTGNYVASQSYGGSGFDADFGIGVNTSGKVAIAGRYTGPATFGSITLPSQPSKSIFVAQVSTATIVTPAPPTAPNAPSLQTASDSGSSNSDNITNVTSPVFNVSGVVTSNTVQLLRDGSVVASRSGPGSITDPGPVSNGNHVYTTIQVDSFNQSSPASASTTVTIITVAPSAPTPPTLLSADDSGVLADGITNVKQPRLTGTATAGSTVQILNASNVVIATGTADPITGAFTLKPSSILADGVFVLHATATDVAGNTSASSTTFTLTIDATAPAAPSSPTLFAADDSGVLGDGITNVKQPRLTGTATAGSTVQILNASNVVIATGTADSTTGAFTLKPSSNLADGVYALHSTATDVAGNTSASSGTFTLTIDATAPAAPTTPVLLAADDSGTLGDGVTNVNQPRLTGTSEAGSTVQILNAANAVIASGMADPTTGVFTLKTTSVLADGTYVVRAQSTDIAGNVGAASGTFSLTIITAVPLTPAAPSLLAADDSGLVGDNLTYVAKPRLTGTTSGASSVQILNGSGTMIGSGVVSNNGYTIALASAFADGVYAIRVQVIDAAGNLSAPSTALTLTIDTKAPTTPTSPTLLAADDSGVLGDGITNVASPRFVGTTEPNANVQLTASNVVIGTATAGADGTYTVKPTNPITNLISSIRVQAIDAAGNVSTASPSFTLYLDTISPAAPSTPTLLSTDDTGTIGDGITSVRQPTLIGTTENGSSVRLLDANGNVLGASSWNSGTTYSIKITSTLADGVYAIRAQATDNAGNLGPASSPFTLTILNSTPLPTPPSTPVLMPADDSGVQGDNLTNVNKPRLTGTATAGTTVQIVNGSGTVLGSAAVGSNGNYTVAFTNAIPDGAITVQTRIMNGNSVASNPSGALTLTILTATPATPATPTLLSADDTGVKGDGITANNRPRISGTAAPGMTVSLVNGNGLTLATTAVPQSGAFNIAPNSSLADGTTSLKLMVTDAAGNPSALSTALNLKIDTVAPAAPTIPVLYTADDTGVVGDGITNVAQPRLATTAEGGSSVVFVTSTGSVIASGVANANGSVLFQTSAPLSDGAYMVTAVAADIAGNTSLASPSFTLTIMAAAPAAPSVPALNSLDDSGVAGDSKTSVRRPRFTGTALPGTTVQLLNGSNTVIGTTTASSANGSFSVQPSSNLAVGNYVFSTRVVNAAGSTAVSNGALSLAIIDTTPGDFDGDGKSDLGVFRPATAQWIVSYSGGSGALINQFGATNLYDIPVNGDYDGTGKVIQAVFRPSTGQWLIGSPTSPRVISFGASNLFDIPVPGDYDGVGYTEIAVFRPSTAQWMVLGPNGGHILGAFGATNLFDIPVPGDYDGSGRTEMAVFRLSTGEWFYQSATGGKALGAFGATGGFDVPVPGDYDGVGRTEVAVFRPSTAQWFVNSPGGGRLLATFGATGFADIPLETTIGALKKAGIIKIPNMYPTAISNTPIQPTNTTSMSSSAPSSTLVTPSTTGPKAVISQSSISRVTPRSKFVVNQGNASDRPLSRIRWNGVRWIHRSE